MFTFYVNHVLAYIPTWMWPILAGGGVAAFFLAGVGSYVPALSPYANFIKPISFITICVSFFMWGGAGVQDVYQAEVNEQKAKADAAEQASKDTNNQLQKTLVSQNQIILQKTKTLNDIIASEGNRINKNCTIDSATVNLYNNIVTNSITTPAGVKK